VSRAPVPKFAIKKEVEVLSKTLLKLSWIIFLILGAFSALISKSKLMPVTNTILFAIILYLIFRGDFNFNDMLIAVYRVFSVQTSIILLTYTLNFNWNRLIVESENEQIAFESSAYFSPFAHLFNLPPRASGPFGNPQLAAVFSLFGIACFFMAKNSKKSVFALISMTLFGSLTGSRTFYAILLCLMLYYLFANRLPKSSFSFWTALMVSTALLLLAIFNFILPLIVKNTTTITNLTGRKVLWSLILENWNSDSLLGHGPNTLHDYAINHVYVGFAHAHNSILQALWDFGLLGVSTILTIIITQCFVISKNSEHRYNGIGIFLCLILIQTEPTFKIGIQITSWFWLIPLIFAFSRHERMHESQANTDLSRPNHASN